MECGICSSSDEVIKPALSIFKDFCEKVLSLSIEDQEELHLCSKCSSRMSSALSTNEKIDSLEWRARSLQRNLLGVLQELQNSLNVLEGQMKEIEGSVKTSEGEGHILKGNMKGKDDLHFRNQMLNVTQDLNTFQNGLRNRFPPSINDLFLNEKEVSVKVEPEGPVRNYEEYDIASFEEFFEGLLDLPGEYQVSQDPNHSEDTPVPNSPSSPFFFSKRKNPISKKILSSSSSSSEDEAFNTQQKENEVPVHLNRVDDSCEEAFGKSDPRPAPVSSKRKRPISKQFISSSSSEHSDDDGETCKTPKKPKIKPRSRKVIKSDSSEDENTHSHYPSFEDFLKLTSTEEEAAKSHSDSEPVKKISFDGVDPFKKFVICLLLGGKSETPEGNTSHASNSPEFYLQKLQKYLSLLHFNYNPELKTVHLHGIGVKINEKTQTISCSKCRYKYKLNFNKNVATASTNQKAKTQLRNHIVTQHLPNIHCPICEESKSVLYNPQSFQTHLGVHINQRPSSPCKICGKEAKNVGSMKRHMQIHKTSLDSEAIAKAMPKSNRNSNEEKDDGGDGSKRRKSSLKSISKMKEILNLEESSSSSSSSSSDSENELRKNIFKNINKADDEYEPDSEDEEVIAKDNEFKTALLGSSPPPSPSLSPPPSPSRSDEEQNQEQKESSKQKFKSLEDPFKKIDLTGMSHFRKYAMRAILRQTIRIPASTDEEDEARTPSAPLNSAEYHLQKLDKELKLLYFDYKPDESLIHLQGVGLIINEEAKTVDCTLCPYKFKFSNYSQKKSTLKEPRIKAKRGVKRHILAKHFPKRPCPICLELLPSQSTSPRLYSLETLKSHLLFHQNKYSKTCKICGRPMTEGGKAMKLHLWTHKSAAEKVEAELNGEVNPQKQETVTCPTCGKQFNGKALLQQHLRTHLSREEREVICELCGQAVLKKQLKIHATRFCPAVKSERVNCPNCEKTFKDKIILKKHIKRTHSKNALERPFLCELCSKRFKLQEDLNLHHKTCHQEVKTFFCEKCGKGFFIQKNLTRHNCPVEGGRGKGSGKKVKSKMDQF